LARLRRVARRHRHSLVGARHAGGPGGGDITAAWRLGHGGHARHVRAAAAVYGSGAPADHAHFAHSYAIARLNALGTWQSEQRTNYRAMATDAGATVTVERMLPDEKVHGTVVTVTVLANQSINQLKILKAPHEHRNKRSHIPAQPYGQQTPRREASAQAWGAKSESRQALACACVTCSMSCTCFLYRSAQKPPQVYHIIHRVA